jgi:hypothetical protein
MPTSHSVQSLLNNLVQGWGDKYGPILDGLGLHNVNDLCELTDDEVKEVLLAPTIRRCTQTGYC